MATFGALSGIALAVWCLTFGAVPRGATQTWRQLRWASLLVALAAAGCAFWVWQAFLWDMHYHPGGGGPIPPPTTLAVLAMPLISLGVGGAVLLLVELAYLARRHSQRTVSRSG